MEGRLRGEGLKENKKGTRSLKHQEEQRQEKEMWMINDASSKWMKKIWALSSLHTADVDPA